ncbi:MAG: glycosyltransferase [Lachnospiraceae bacterium]|nr:glycosyltransferase [Lachnospiraceae bacterium]
MGRRFFLDKRSENKKIVIYGASLTGKMLYEQIRDINFAQVIAFVDRNAERMQGYLQNNDIDCEVYKPEWLFENTGYDFVFLATSNLDAKRAITAYLIDNGIENGRVIFLEESFYDGEQEYRIIDDVDTAFNQLLQANETLKKAGRKLVFDFTFWMRIYFRRLTDQEGFINKVKDEIYHQESLETRIMLSRCLLRFLKQGDAQIAKKLIHDISELPEEQYEWANMLYHFSAHMEMKTKTSLYKGLGQERRRIGKKLADYFCRGEQFDFGNYRENPDRIVLMVPWMRSENDSNTMIYRKMANVLSQRGKRVLLLVVLFPKEQCFGFMSISDDGPRKSTIDYFEQNRQWLDDKVEFEYVEEDSAKSLFNRVIQRINEFKPGCIIDATKESFPLSAILYQHYPVLNFPSRTCTIASFFHKTTAGLFEYNQEIEPYYVQFPKLKVEKEATRRYNREEKLQIPEDSFVIVTVGHRLGSEVTLPLVERVMSLLEKRDDMYWVLVGDISVGEYFSTDMAAYDKIRVIPYEEDLIALYRLCDVFLNPDRSGGGFSAMFAMQEGVVVATLNTGDVAKWVGRLDRQWLVEGGYKELCEYIEKLYEDRQLLAEVGKQMQQAMKYSGEEWEEALFRVVEELSKMEIRDFRFEI